MNASNSVVENLLVGDDKPLALRDAEGRTIVCKRGTVWITIENESRDVLLKRGQNFAIGSPGLTLVSAIGGSAAVRICGAETAAPRPELRQVGDYVAHARTLRAELVGDLLRRFSARLRAWRQVVSS